MKFNLDVEVGEVFQFTQGLQRLNLDGASGKISKKIYSDGFLVQNIITQLCENLSNHLFYQVVFYAEDSQVRTPLQCLSDV